MRRQAPRAVLLGFVLAGLAPATAAAAAPRPFEAERALFPRSVGRVVRDAGAHGRRAVRLGADGSLRRSLKLPALAAISVRARGQRCGGWPRMRISVDGRRVGSVLVGSRRWRSYRARVDLPAGRHWIAVAYVNDRRARGCDRALTIDRVSFVAATSRSGKAPAPGAAAAVNAPAVRLTSPGDGARVWGVTPVGAQASSARGVARVELLVDGAVAASDESAPYELRWDTRGRAAGSEPRLAVRAVDTAGVDATSASIGVRISRTVPLGSAVQLGYLENDATYRDTYLSTFSSLTPEFELKMDRLQPQQDVFDFTVGDGLVDFAQATGRAVRGHVLVWGNGPLPEWLTDGTWTHDQLVAILENHVKTVVAHFKDQIHTWDVVNEAFEADGSYRHNIWFDGIGPEYVALAFGWAHEADPDARLFYNEVSAERLGGKSDQVLLRLGALLADGVPVNGFGMQSHTGTLTGITRDELETNMRRFAALGLDVEITEMDVKTSGTPGSVADKQAAQADVFRRYATACREVSACSRFSVWGVSDSTSWLGTGEMGTLFDTGFSAKPAYAAVADELGVSPGPPAG